MTTWRKLINELLEQLNDGPLIACTLSDTELDIEFYDGFGGSEGKPFTAWTNNYVLFPVVYDGNEWVGSVPRNPCDQATDHQGGE